MDYKWMLQNGESAKLVREYLLKGDLQNALYNFAFFCKMGYSQEEIEIFVDNLLQDVEKE